MSKDNIGVFDVIDTPRKVRAQMVENHNREPTWLSRAYPEQIMTGLDVRYRPHLKTVYTREGGEPSTTGGMQECTVVMIDIAGVRL